MRTYGLRSFEQLQPAGAETIVAETDAEALHVTGDRCNGVTRDFWGDQRLVRAWRRVQPLCSDLR